VTGYRSIWQLSRELETYHDLLAAICVEFSIPIVHAGRGRVVAESDIPMLIELHTAWKNRPKMSYLSGRARKPKRAAPKPSPACAKLDWDPFREHR